MAIHCEDRPTTQPRDQYNTTVFILSDITVETASLKKARNGKFNWIFQQPPLAFNKSGFPKRLEPLPKNLTMYCKSNATAGVFRELTGGNE